MYGSATGQCAWFVTDVRGEYREAEVVSCLGCG